MVKKDGDLVLLKSLKMVKDQCSTTDMEGRRAHGINIVVAFVKVESQIKYSYVNFKQSIFRNLK